MMAHLDAPELPGRFWSKAQQGIGCWLWTGAKDRKGYGMFSVGPARDEAGRRRNSMVLAHRVAYTLAVGPIPAGLFACHRCDNPGCVNPAHLFLGTNADNVRDMDAKGRRVTRSMRGSAHGCAILTEAEVAEIFAITQAKAMTQTEAAKRFGVALSTVNHIHTGRLWAHVTGVAR